MLSFFTFWRPVNLGWNNNNNDGHYFQFRGTKQDQNGVSMVPRHVGSDYSTPVCSWSGPTILKQVWWHQCRTSFQTAESEESHVKKGNQLVLTRTHMTRDRMKMANIWRSWEHWTTSPPRIHTYPRHSPIHSRFRPFRRGPQLARCSRLVSN